jgi:predicted transcriptional regulator
MGLEGNLREFPVTDIIQMVSLSKQTGVAEIEGILYGNQTRGRVYFEGGKIVHAELENLPAREAALNFFIFEDGRFRFINNVLSDRKEITGSNEFLVIEGVNRSDEWKKIKDILPSNDIIPKMVEDNPLALNGGGQVNLQASEWKLLTRINGEDDIATLARKTGLGEFVTAKTVAHLLELGLVEKKQRNVKYILYAELDQLAVTQLGTTARSLLDQSYQRMDLTPEDDLQYEQALEIVNQFERLSKLLVGPGRAGRLAEQMRERVMVIFNIK